VTDTGSGIPPDLLPHVFEPFYTTKESRDGAGLGLASVYGIAKQHQGWVEVESQTGQGTSFRAYFPASAGAVLPSPEISARAPEPGCGTILVAEDQENLRLLLNAVLASSGYRVIEAVNGVEALGLWRVHSREIDLLLTDMEMPGGLNGRELALALLAEKPDLPVIYSSGYSIALFGASSLLEEGVNFLAKPYTPDRLIEIVRNTLAKPRGKDEV
jgi:CheY-like chemotaxis protein